MNLLTLIISLFREGKSAIEIARELHSQGLTNERGKTISPDMVIGFLRFAGISTEAGALPAMETAKGAVWGAARAKEPVEASFDSDEDLEVTPGKKRNRGFAGKSLSDELRAKIAHMFQHEGKCVAEIAKELGLDSRRISGFCGHLAGFDALPGEVTVFVENGQTITRCPPGFARGAYPQRNVGAKGGW